MALHPIFLSCAVISMARHNIAGKMMAAVHCYTMPCKTNTVLRYKESQIFTVLSPCIKNIE